MDDETIKRIEDAAWLLAGGHSQTAQDMLFGALAEVYNSRAGTGMRAHQFWLASLEMLATVLLAIVKMERSKRKD